MNNTYANNNPENNTPEQQSQNQLHDFIKNEFSNSLIAIAQGIAALRINLQGTSLSADVLKGVQNLKNSATIANLTSLAPLLLLFEQYLQLLQREATISVQKVDELEALWKELWELTQFDSALFLEQLQNKKSTIEKWIAKIEQSIKRLNGKNNSLQNSLPQVQVANLQPSLDVIQDPTLFDLFRVELETQSAELNQGLVTLEQNPYDIAPLESLMRAAHSIKGAARIVALEPIVQLAHCVEDLFVMCQKQQLQLSTAEFDGLLRAVDVLSRLAKIDFSTIKEWMSEQTPTIKQIIQELGTNNPSLSMVGGIEKTAITAIPLRAPRAPIEQQEKIANSQAEIMKAFARSFSSDRVLRVTAQSINHLMGLAGESLVESRWLYPFEQQLLQLKNQYDLFSDNFDVLREQLRNDKVHDKINDKKEDQQLQALNLAHQLHDIRAQLSERLNELDNFIRRHSSLSDRLYQEVINSRMRPFADGVRGFPRLVRDLGRQLGKQVKLIILGQNTPVDRDILEKLEAPLSHFLRNAVDHGIETPQERINAGKAPDGIITLEARHRGGMLAIRIADDGRGLDIEKLRQKIIEKKLTSPEMVRKLSDAEVVDFLFLPGFSTAVQVTEISGRGVGLDVVQNVIREVGGVVRTSFEAGRGMSFDLQLPLTLSVIRSLLVEISGEIYAFPLARIDQALVLPSSDINVVEGRQFFHSENQNIGIVTACQVLELQPTLNKGLELFIIMVSDRLNRYGIVVDKILGEKELVVQELDKRLRKVPDIMASSVMEDGAPVLIIDVEDIVRSIDHILSGNRLSKISYETSTETANMTKRILVVDDSMTVREVECRILKQHGYRVDSAINGIDGWNALRIQNYDLIITDVDMPRMNGIELVSAIKQDQRLRDIPVIIVSYKIGDEDRAKGLAAGADYYLTKSSFHDTKLLEVVHEFIGDP